MTVAENLLHEQVEFLGYVQDLLMGRIHDSDVQRHDLVMMCYNASETFIMLTGEAGWILFKIVNTSLQLTR